MSATIANVEMAAAWDDEGEEWARDWERYDRSVRAHHSRMMAAAAITAGERVLDVGCGNGQSTRDAARAADPAVSLGVDLSSAMLERARSLADAEGVTNVRFQRADAQVHPFEAGGFDVVLSRFGAMFFADSIAAFTNIAIAIRPAGRLVLVGWREIARNEWLQAIRGALGLGRQLPVPPPHAPSPFSLSDPDIVHARLTAAGFEHVEFEPLDEPFWAGADADDAAAFISRTGAARGLVGDLDDADRKRALDTLHATMGEHETADGVVLGSSAWLITARRAGR